MKNQPIAERFMEKVAKDEATGCWNFTSSISKKAGNGRFTMNGRSRDAYKVAYEMFVGAVPEGLHLHHRCENRRCVNPNHLIPVTRSEHYAQLSPNHFIYKCARKTHCPKGHPLIEGNLVLSRLKNGSRLCLTCQRAASLNYVRRVRAERRRDA